MSKSREEEASSKSNPRAGGPRDRVSRRAKWLVALSLLAGATLLGSACDPVSPPATDGGVDAGHLPDGGGDAGSPDGG